MKVLITVPSLTLPGGVANYFRTLRRHLSKDHVYFEVGARPGNNGPVATIVRVLRDHWNFSRELRRTRYDLVHLNPSLGPLSVVRDGILLLIAKAHRRRVLVFFHGWDPACETAIRAHYLRLFRFVYGRADLILVLAEEFRHTLREFGIGAPILTETMIVADEVFPLAVAGRPASRADHLACRILFLSRLDRGKGLVEAIEAFEMLQGVKVELQIAGDGPERAAGEAMVKARRINGVTFLGHVEDAAKVEAFRQGDIYLFTSMYEGMPNSVLEAMAFGLPIVTRTVGGLRDFFEHDRMGYATESQDPSVFAELLNGLVSNPSLRASMGQYNREFARKRFAASVVSTRLLSTYEQVVGQSTSS